MHCETNLHSSNMQLSDLHESAGVPTQEVMHDRFTHIAELESFESRDNKDFDRWANIRLDRWLVDWALRSGKEETAKKIALEKGIEVRLFVSL